MKTIFKNISSEELALTLEKIADLGLEIHDLYGKAADAKLGDMTQTKALRARTDEFIRLAHPLCKEIARSRFLTGMIEPDLLGKMAPTDLNLESLVKELLKVGIPGGKGMLSLLEIARQELGSEKVSLDVKGGDINLQTDSGHRLLVDLSVFDPKAKGEGLRLGAALGMAAKRPPYGILTGREVKDGKAVHLEQIMMNGLRDLDRKVQRVLRTNMDVQEPAFSGASIWFVIVIVLVIALPLATAAGVDKDQLGIISVVLFIASIFATRDTINNRFSATDTPETINLASTCEQALELISTQGRSSDLVGTAECGCFEACG